jgi:16S rRNA (guanine(966)-N(2))-methyltransferase RsmD
VISGSKKGIKIEIPKTKNVRPTIDRVKEAIFSIIQFEIKNKCFLDLFAGSGQVGIESLSRGASGAIFVDKFYYSVLAIKKNLSNLKLENKAKVFMMDAATFLENTDLKFDLAFLDPPYSSGVLKQILPLLVKKMLPNGIIIRENSINNPLEDIKGFKIRKLYKYSNVSVVIYDKQ